jgi:hypothetical protein
MAQETKIRKISNDIKCNYYTVVASNGFMTEQREIYFKLLPLVIIYKKSGQILKLHENMQRDKAWGGGDGASSSASLRNITLRTASHVTTRTSPDSKTRLISYR